jgi:spore photoproduct lyase
MSFVTEVTRKSMLIRPSGRSTDYISPSFGHGCLYNCSYCYMKRNKPTGLSIAKNHGDILTAISDHAWFADVEKPNQTHEEYITYDISCNEDFALHAKYHQWERIFDFFTMHPRAMGSFATKYVNEKFLTFNPQGKIRIRFSLMPEIYRKQLEPGTDHIIDRLSAVKKFLDAGYEVHLNFSPVIVTANWLTEYKNLFHDISIIALLNDWANDKVKAEVIFLTHNVDKHYANIVNQLPGESLLWKPDIQEKKISQYGGANLRYKHTLKAQYIEQFKQLHQEIIPWCTIRYCFTLLLLINIF